MNIVYNHFNIDELKIDQLHKSLINVDFFLSLSKGEREVLDDYKGGVMDKNGIMYFDYANRFINNALFCTIKFARLREFVIRMDLMKTTYADNINMHDLYFSENLRNFLLILINKKNDAILKNIAVLDNIFKKAPISKNNFSIYRICNDPIQNNVIESYSSWSLIPSTIFCAINYSFLYVAQIDKIPFIYLELPPNNTVRDMPSQDKLYNYEYEFFLPRGIKFSIIKQEELTVPNFQIKSKQNIYPTHKLIIVYIKFLSVTETPVPPLNVNFISLQT